MNLKKITFYVLVLLAILWTAIFFLMFSDKDLGFLLFSGIHMVLLIFISIVYKTSFKEVFIENIDNSISESEEWSTENMFLKTGFALLIIFILFGLILNTLFFPFNNFEEIELLLRGCLIYLILAVFSVNSYKLFQRMSFENNSWSIPLKYKKKFISLSVMGFLGLILIIYSIFGFIVVINGLANQPSDPFIDFLTNFLPGF